MPPQQSGISYSGEVLFFQFRRSPLRGNQRDGGKEFTIAEGTAKVRVGIDLRKCECVFAKHANDTALKVEFNGDLRIAYCLYCCNRWFFTFNGAECKGPLAIDGLHHIADNQGRTDTNIHKITHIGGYCQGIPKGNVRVGINVGACVGRKLGNASTGWNSVTRIMIEEVPPPQK